MVELWEIEWNSSMIQHGRDLGTMEFIFAKGGNLSDMNYVMFDVQDNTWEPLIKAVAERDHSHPDIIRKNVPQQQQQPFFMDNSQQGALPFMGTGARSAREMNRLYNAGQRAADLQNYAQDPSAMNALRAGKYGTAAGKGLINVGRGIMQGARATRDYMRDTAGPKMKEMAGRGVEAAGRGLSAAKDMTGRGLSAAKDMTGRGLSAAADMAGRGLQAVKDSGLGERMKNFMSGAGRAISDLRFLPQAAKQSYKQMVAAGEDEARRSALEGGLSRGQKEIDDASRRAVPGSQFYDSEMDRARASTSQGLSRDFNITPRVHEKGKNKGQPMESVEDAMRREIQEIGERRKLPKEGFFAGMRRRGDERREAKAAQQRGDAFAPSNIVPEEPPKLPDAPTPEAEAAANADAKVTDTNEDMNIDFGPETGTPPDTGVVGPQPSQKATDAMAIFDKVQENKRKRMGMETATATEPTRGQSAVTGAGMKIGATAGDRVAGGLDDFFAQHEKTPFADREAARQAMLQGNIGTSRMKEAGKFSGKTAKAVEQVLTEMYGPAQAKAIVQAAEQGNPDAQEIVEEAAEKTDNSDMNIDFGSEMMTLSADEHQAAWDSLLKQMSIR
tara:strand:- start:58 stop:1899 length:1842 start_codon:yes stop_codon:yes gene_type:complete